MNKKFKFFDLKTSLIFSFIIHILFYFIFSYLSIEKPTCMPIPIEIMDIKTSQKNLNNKILNEKINEQINEILNKKINENNLEEKKITKDILIKNNETKNKKEKDPLIKKPLKNKNNLIKNIDIHDDTDDEILTLSDESNITKTEKNSKKNIEKTKPDSSNSTTEVKFEKEFPFDYYARLIIKKINQNWEKPFIPGATAKTIVYFKILKNGEITDIKIYQKSKYENFDKSAMIAIIASNKLPELPTDYKESSLGVYFAFEFL